MLRVCRAGDYATSPHHHDPTVDVHIFKPQVARRRWYIKAYFIEEDDQTAVVLSVHPSDFP